MSAEKLKRSNEFSELMFANEFCIFHASSSHRQMTNVSFLPSQKMKFVRHRCFVLILLLSHSLVHLHDFAHEL